MLTRVRVRAEIRCAFAIVVYGAKCMKICRIGAIVGAIVESECSTRDVEAIDIFEEVGLHQGGQAGGILQL
jgi:hypothetical protein